MKTPTLISLGVLCDYDCTITLKKQTITVQNNVQHILTGHGNKHTRMWEVPLTPNEGKERTTATVKIIPSKKNKL